MQTLEEERALSRRLFLRNGLFTIAGGIAAAIGVPLLGYFISPALRGEGDNWVPIAHASEIPIGQPTPIEYAIRIKDGWVRNDKRRAAWIVTKDGNNFTVFDPRCTHLGCAYSWRPDRKLFLCPCHDGLFDIDGNVIGGPPPRPLDRLQVRVERGNILVGGLTAAKE